MWFNDSRYTIWLRIVSLIMIVVIGYLVVDIGENYQEYISDRSLAFGLGLGLLFVLILTLGTSKLYECIYNANSIKDKLLVFLIYNLRIIGETLLVFGIVALLAGGIGILNGSKGLNLSLGLATIICVIVGYIITRGTSNWLGI
jgi:hypothetical protein